LGSEPLYLSWLGSYTSFSNGLYFVFQDTSTKPITDEWEFGVSLRKKEKPLKVWLMYFERLCLAYRFSYSDGEGRISFIFRSVYNY